MDIGYELSIRRGKEVTKKIGSKEENRVWKIDKEKGKQESKKKKYMYTYTGLKQKYHNTL